MRLKNEPFSYPVDVSSNYRCCNACESSIILLPLIFCESYISILAVLKTVSISKRDLRYSNMPDRQLNIIY
jgi:hypothetical protein